MSKVGKGLSVLAVMFVAGCGGGSGSSDPILSNSARATLLDNTGNDIFDTFVRNQDVLELAELPSGRVQYTGVISTFGGVGNQEDGTDEVRLAYLGELELEADFTSGNISGAATNFIDIENPQAIEGAENPIGGADVSGTLTLTGSQSGGTEAFYDLSVTGELAGPEGSFLSYDDLSGTASIFGANADAIRVSGVDENATFDGEAGFVAFAGVGQR